MWPTDYPHSDRFFPGAPQMIRERLEALSPAGTASAIVRGAMGFYGLN
jgi:hypothetical protein